MRTKNFRLYAKIYELLQEGETYRSIADQLKCSFTTIRNSKLHYNETIPKYIENGWQTKEQAEKQHKFQLLSYEIHKDLDEIEPIERENVPTEALENILFMVKTHFKDELKEDIEKVETFLNNEF